MSAAPNRNIEDDLPIPSFLDPYREKNRVPKEVGLLGYEAPTESNQRTALVLEDQILRLRESLNTIQVRRSEQQENLEATRAQLRTAKDPLAVTQIQAHYKEKQRELESTQAQLHTATDLLLAAKKQQVVHHAQRGDISIPVHPIQRCPEDVLRDMFQKVAETTSTVSRIKQSVWLSSVCRQSRFIALDSPSLWGSLDLDLGYSHESQAYLRCKILPRIRHSAAFLMVSPINSKTAPALRVCGINEVPNIGHLCLTFSTARDVRLLTGTDFQPPTGISRALVILTSQPSRPIVDGWWHHQEVKITDVIGRFPPIEDLKTRHIRNMVFQRGSTIPSVRKIVLSGANNIMILNLFRTFPKLEHLELRGANLRVDGNPTTLLVPSLKYLSLPQTAGDSWMAHVSIPNMHTLLYQSDCSEAVMAFISAHSSLTKLDCSFAHGITPSLTSAAPQLLELIISSSTTSIICGDIDESLSLPFPLLESVIIIIRHPHASLTLPEFDGFVCSRCLPMKHPKSRARRAEHVLSYFSISVVYPSPEWHESEFYKSSTRTVHSRDPKVECLTWPDWA